MTKSEDLVFVDSEQLELAVIDSYLHSNGWSNLVTVKRELQNWRALCEELPEYQLTIDDYTNNLTSRDALEIVLERCQAPLRTKLSDHIEKSDELFRAVTAEDAFGVIGKFYKIDVSDGWWWRRKPVAGPLAEFLSQYVQRSAIK